MHSYSDLVATDAVQIEAKPMIGSVITVFALNNSPNVPTSPPLNPNVDPAPTIDSKAGPGLANKTETDDVSMMAVGHFQLKVNQISLFFLTLFAEKNVVYTSLYAKSWNEGK